MMEISGIEGLGLGCQHPFLDLDADPTQPGDALASHPVIRIDRTHDDPGYARHGQRIDAGGSPTDEIAGLEGHNHGSSPRAGSGCGQGNDLGVRISGTHVRTLADHLSVPIQHDCPDLRIWVSAVGGRQFERPAHERGVVLTTQAFT
jgi:hypothetical protein